MTYIKNEWNTTHTESSVIPVFFHKFYPPLYAIGKRKLAASRIAIFFFIPFHAFIINFIFPPNREKHLHNYI